VKCEGSSDIAYCKQNFYELIAGNVDAVIPVKEEQYEPVRKTAYVT
jgi:hypothetical protein